MSEWTTELAGRLVIGRKRDGRCVYDAEAKRELVLASRMSMSDEFSPEVSK